jgi:hypothetical protein
VPLPAVLQGVAIAAAAAYVMRGPDTTGTIVLPIVIGLFLIAFAVQRNYEGEVLLLGIALVGAAGVVSGVLPGGVLARTDELGSANLWRGGYVVVACIAVMVRMPLRQDVYISYARSDDTPERHRGDHLIQRLRDTLVAWGRSVHLDVDEMRRGDSVSEFERDLGQAQHVIVVLSNAYLRSLHCMWELIYLYQHALEDKNRFLKHVAPVVLDDAEIDTPVQRDQHVQYWHAEVQRLEALGDRLGKEDRQLLRRLQRGAQDMSDILTYLADANAPRGYDAIVADDFRAVRELLDRLQDR